MAELEGWKFRFHNASAIDKAKLCSELSEEAIAFEETERREGVQHEVDIIVIVVGIRLLGYVVRYFLRNRAEHPIVEVVLPDGTTIRIPLAFGKSAEPTDKLIEEMILKRLEDHISD